MFKITLLIGNFFLAACYGSPLPQSASEGGATSNGYGFGAGASAGIGGFGRSVGIGNFQSNPGSSPFLPWGAYAGINLGGSGDAAENGDGTIGAGCSGLNCGFQLGSLALSTRQLFDAVTNRNGSTGHGLFEPRRFFQQPLNWFSQLQQQFLPIHPQSQSDNSSRGVAEFARSGRIGGKPFFQSTSINIQPDGQVTTIENESGKPTKVSTSKLDDANGVVIAASGTKVESDGNQVSGLRKVEALK